MDVVERDPAPADRAAVDAKGTVSGNSFRFLVAQVVTAAFNLGGSIAIARAVGPTVLGSYNYLVWIVGVASAVGTLGLPNAIVRFTAQLEPSSPGAARRVAAHLLRLTLVVATVVGVAVFFCTRAGLFGGRSGTVIAALVAVAVVANITSLAVLSLLRGQRRYRSIMVGLVVAVPLDIAGLVAILELWRTTSGLLLYFSINSAVGIVTLVVAAGGKLGVARGRVDKSVRTDIFRYLASVSIVILMDQVVWDRSEVVFLQHYAGARQVAFYTLAYVLISNVMTMIPGSVTNALFPHVASVGADPDALREAYNGAVIVVSLAVCYLSFGGIAVAHPAVTTVFGDRYVGMVTVFRVLLLSGGIGAIVSVASTVLYATARQKALLVIGAVLTALNIGGDFVIIPRFGADGAAATNAVTQGVGAALLILVLWRLTGLALPARALRSVAGGAAAWLLVWCCFGSRSSGPVALVESALVFTAVYVVAVVLLRWRVASDVRAGGAHLRTVAKRTSGK